MIVTFLIGDIWTMQFKMIVIKIHWSVLDQMQDEVTNQILKQVEQKGVDEEK